MKLQQALKALKPLTGYDKLTLQEKLNSGSILVTGAMQGQQKVVKYVWKVKGNILYAFKLSDSTLDHIVLTLEQAGKMIPGVFDIIYNQYLSMQGFIDEDVERNFNDVDENLYGKSDAEIRSLIEENDMIVFK